MPLKYIIVKKSIVGFCFGRESQTEYHLEYFGSTYPPVPAPYLMYGHIANVVPSSGLLWAGKRNSQLGMQIERSRPCSVSTINE
jgi:hypothetical protein